MTNVKHTQGPWTARVHDEEFWPFATDVVTESGQMIAGTNYFESKNGKQTGNRIDEANARIISAAPEMLEALHCIIDAIDKGPYKRVADAIETCMDAIAKAEGGGLNPLVDVFHDIRTESREAGR